MNIHSLIITAQTEKNLNFHWLANAQETAIAIELDTILQQKEQNIDTRYNEDAPLLWANNFIFMLCPQFKHTSWGLIFSFLLMRAIPMNIFSLPEKTNRVN